MATYKYDHIHFRSEDPHAARKFWEEMFGAECTRERELGGAPSFTMDLNGMIFQVSGRAEGEDPVRTIWIISFVGPNAVFSCKIKVLASPCHHLARGPNG